MATSTPLPRIFVQIASYRDLECHRTVRDLFEKAAHPDRVNVGICWQYDPKEDAECFAVDYPRPEQVRVIQYHVRDSRGAGWARGEAQTLWQGEEYTLQIHAHMRFEPGWDETLIAMLARCPSPKSVLTAWLPEYRLPNRKQALDGMIPMVRILSCAYEHDAQFLHLEFMLRPQKEVAAVGPALCCSWVGNFMFSRSSVIKEVPSDPHIYFWGEELNYSARLWTHGYDIYQCDRVVAWHYWYRTARDAKDQDIYRNHTDPRNQKSLKRIRHLLGLQHTDDAEVLKDIAKYPLGNARSIAQYYAYIGVDFQRGVVEPKGIRGEWSLGDMTPRPSIPPNGGKPSIFICIAAYRDAEWQHTVNDAFGKANDPERVFAGVCLQYDYENDKKCFTEPLPRHAQIRLRHVPHTSSRGANWARAQAFNLWQGEDYVLVIDSHMRFEPGWDELLLQALKRCPGDKAMLTAWLPGYKPPHNLEADTGKIERLRVSSWGFAGDAQLVNLNRNYMPAAKVRGRMDPACACVANCTFGPAEAFKEVPFDPYIDFWGDEINQSARLWTHGWNFFQADRRILYHYWDPENIKDRDEYRDRKNTRHQRARIRNMHLFGLKTAEDISAIVELDKYPLGMVRRIADYWRFMGIDFTTNTILPHAGRGEWVIPAQPDNKKASLPFIFVNIASYRDPECQWTLKDLFEKAAHPERIRVGICLQADPVEDKACLVNESVRPGQVRISQLHYKDSQGANWARAEAQKFWNGEEYVLQIDSHMRFEPGWDDTLIDMLKRCPSAKPLLCAYLPNYNPPDKRDYNDGRLLRIRIRKFGDENDPQLLHMTATFIGRGDERAGLYPSPFYLANFMFARAQTLKDVPIDPHIHFYGDEISYAARLWTHGWDIFQPDRIVLFHYWVRKESLPQQHYRNTKTEKSKRSLARIRHLLRFEPAHNPQALADIERYGLGAARPLEGLWNFAGIDWQNRTIAKDALEGRWNFLSPPLEGGGRGRGYLNEDTFSKMPPHPALPLKGGGRKSSIFVNIASYRDRECQWTVKDLFEKAAHPERIHVGICWQFDADEDKDCFEVSTRPEQVRMLPVDWREAEGVCWARHQAQQLWDGEDYNLQIDAHMRFVPGWDELMIKELEICDSPKPVLSCTMGMYTPPNALQKNPKPAVRRVRQFQPDGNIRGQSEFIDRVPEKPLNGAFVAAGFVFSKGSIVAEVPYDPYLYFDQEEITYAARLYTHGWDVFSSRSAFMYHYYNDNKAPGGSVRPLHWRDLRKEDEKRIGYLKTRALQRFNHMTGHKLSDDPDITKELEMYGFGRERSLRQFEEYTGIDFKRKIASEKALRCLFVKDLHKYSKGIHIPSLDGQKKADAAAVAVMPPPQPETSVKMLEKGDFIPLFEITDTERRTRAVEMFGGQHSMLFFLPAGDAAYAADFFKALQQHFTTAKHKNVWQLFVLDGTVEQLIELKKHIGTQHILWADPERKLAQAFGLCRASDNTTPATGFVLNNNLRIVHRRMNLGAGQLAADIVDECQNEVAKFKVKNREQRVISELAPTLMIPDAFTPELCEKCIDAFHNGHKFDGTVGAEDKTGYRPGAKVRTDHVISGPLLDEIDEKLSRSVFPEIKKIFGVSVKYRELYKVGLYKGEKGGFFKQHRDNFDVPLGYRRIAMTLNLNDGYEGGGLRFPEYDDHIYRPKAGGAIAFSCATVHEARPVTSGERYILVCFFHGDEEEAFRRHYLAGKGSPLRIKDYVARLRPEPEIVQSRGYLDQWRRKHVKIDG